MPSLVDLIQTWAGKRNTSEYWLKLPKPPKTPKCSLEIDGVVVYVYSDYVTALALKQHNPNIFTFKEHLEMTTVTVLAANPSFFEELEKLITRLNSDGILIPQILATCPICRLGNYVVPILTNPNIFQLALKNTTKPQLIDDLKSAYAKFGNDIDIAVSETGFKPIYPGWFDEHISKLAI